MNPNPNPNQPNWIFGMLNDPTNQIPRSSSNPGSSTQPSFNQIPYYPNYQPQFATQEELLMFQQFKMQQMHQQQPQQLPNQFTISQPHSEQQSHHLEVEDTEDEEESLPTLTSKPSHGGQTAVHSGENDDDHMSRVYMLYDATVRGEFKHRSAWLFLKGKHKWTNPDSTLQRRSRLLGTDEEPEHFGDDELPRPPGLQRLAKSQRTGSNSTASSGSNPAAYQEFMAEQYELDRKAKMTVLERESEDRRRLIQSQRIAEDMRVLQIDTRGMDPVDAAIINAQKAKIRAAYPPPPN
ncbi:hypothetical protein Tco_0290855 [Tanacetum coccineum]